LLGRGILRSGSVLFGKRVHRGVMAILGSGRNVRSVLFGRLSVRRSVLFGRRSVRRSVLFGRRSVWRSVLFGRWSVWRSVLLGRRSVGGNNTTVA
jgi:hypothetical protein